MADSSNEKGLQAAREYLSTLEDLTQNNKTQINLLTILAEDYAEFAPFIVDVIKSRVFAVSRECKLPLLYVADSILKNITTTSAYRDEFAKCILDIFVHVFKEGDERIRASLYKLRNTWKDIFIRGKLMQIDLRIKEIDPKWPTPLQVHEIDPAWPVANPPPRAQPISATVVTPSVPQQQPSTRTNNITTNASGGSSNSTESGARIHVNPNFIAKNDPRLKRRVTEEQQSGGIGEKKIKVEPSSKQRQQSGGSATDPSKKNVLDEILPASPPPTAAHPAPKPLMATAVPPPANLAGPPSSSSSMRPHRRKGDVSFDSRTPYKRMKDDRGGRGGRGPPPSNVSKAPPMPPAPTLQKTVALGAHAFVSAPSNMPQPAFTPMPEEPKEDTWRQGPPQFVPSQPPPSMFAQTPAGLVPVSMPQPLLGPPMGMMPPGAVVTMPLTMPPPLSMVPPTMVMSQPSTMMPPPQLPQPPMPRPPAVITHDQVKLEGIPANNRIFVEGKAHEVMFIGDTAVIERNGLPHRIFFSGPPRNVLIDGQPHLLGFGETKTVYIDGDPHVLKFGAPSRELYMGDFPFKGAFGGPPIYATINGVRHEIRLGGPAPEVKIEPDPSYDLSRFMPSLRQGIKPPEEKKVDMAGVQGLLARLKQHGVLQNQKPAPTTNHSNNTRRGGPFGRGPRRVDMSPPIPSDDRGEVTDRRPYAPDALKDFKLRSLKIRYDNVVDSLFRQRSVCSQCGMHFEELRGEKYNRHLDWHVRQNLKKMHNTAQCQPWYPSIKEWVKAELNSEEEDGGGNAAGSVSKTGHSESFDMDAVVASSSKNSENKECFVCGDKFEEYFDQDKDLWRYKDCVLVGQRVKRACHTACAADATLDEDAMETAATEEEDDAHSKPSPFVFASGENESATTVKTEFSAVASCH